MAAENDVVLSYHDSLIRNSDFKLLGKSQWLNDNVIGFAFEYFEKCQYAKFSTHVSFVGPQVTQCFKLMSAEEAQLFIEPLNLMEKQLVFFAVNDNMSLSNTGGTHWSLLVLSTADQRCRHYDSLHHNNTESALQIYRMLKPMFKGDLKFEQSESPQQTNSHDCGVYVICIAEYLCAAHFLPSNSSSVSLFGAVNSTTVSEKREKLKTIILALSKSSQS